MASQIIKIKDRLLEILQDNATGLGVAATSITANRIRKLDNDDLPAIVIYTKNESVVDLTVNANFREYKRQLQVSIDIITQANSSVDDSSLALADKVETVLLREDSDIDNPEGPAWSDLRYSGLELTLEPSGDIDYAIHTINLTVDYYKEVDYEPLDDLSGFTADYELQVGLAGQAEGRDIIDL